MTIVACVQMTSGGDIDDNIDMASTWLAAAVQTGAGFVALPETCGIFEINRKKLFEKLHAPQSDPFIAAMRQRAKEYGIWLLIGSTPVRVRADRAANRSFLLNPQGEITASYDKIHLFDVDLPGGERYRESQSYIHGQKTIVTKCADFTLGLTICYDLPLWLSIPLSGPKGRGNDCCSFRFYPKNRSGALAYSFARARD